MYGRRAGDVRKAIVTAMSGRKAVTIEKLRANVLRALEGSWYSGSMVAYDKARLAYEHVVRPGKELG